MITENCMKIKELVNAATEEKANYPNGLKSVLNRIKNEEYTTFSQEQFEELELGSLSEFNLKLILSILDSGLDLSGVPKAKQAELIKAIAAALALRERDTLIVKALFEGDFTQLDKTFPEAHEKRQFLCETRYTRYINNDVNILSTARLIQTQKWCTILHFICMPHNYTPKTTTIIKGLLSRGADPKTKATGGNTPLHLLMQDNFNNKIPQCIMYLAIHTKNGDVTKVSGSEVFQCIQEGFHQTVKLFLDAGADIAAPNEHGFTPFHLAVLHFHYPVVEHFGQIFKARRSIIDSFTNDLPIPVRGLIVDYYYVSVSYQKDNPVLFEGINVGDLLLKVLSVRYTSHPQWEERRRKTAEILLKHAENPFAINDQGKSMLTLAKELSAQNCALGIDDPFVAAVRDKVTLQELKRKAANAQNENTPTLIGNSSIIQSPSIAPEALRLSK